MLKNLTNTLLLFSFAVFCPLSAADPSIEASTPQVDTSESTADAEGIAFFESKIRPVLIARCYGCHSADADEIEGGLLLDTREGIRRGGDVGPAVVPRDLHGSLLLESIRYESLEMPPDEQLDKSVIDDFTKWISMGAPDPRDGKSMTAPKANIDLEKGRQHWAYVPVVTPDVPSPDDAGGTANWCRSDIDRFILSGLHQADLQPVGDAGPMQLLRRIYYDLNGLPPTPDQISTFQSAYRNNADAAIESVIDELLASREFGERWGRHWLDLARYAESNGGASNYLVPLAPRYRDYVISAFEHDKPYDKFVREQLAGDLLPAGSDIERNEQLIATAFLSLGLKDMTIRDQHRFRMSIAQEQIDVFGRAFLGQTFACAECHDHKFDPISTEDYYALAGIFYSSQPLVGIQDKHTGYVFELATLAGHEAMFKGDNYAEFRHLQTKKRNSYSRLRSKKHELLNKAGLSKASQKEQSQYLSSNPAIDHLAKQLEEATAKMDDFYQRFAEEIPRSLIAIRDIEMPTDVAVHLRGEASDLGEIAPRGFPKVLVNDATPEINRDQSGRLELANWIASQDNALTARVMVNRIWLHLFGAGLVDSPDNFGTTGQPPSNPALLDHLAGRFVAHKWSVKSMIREIMLSHVYSLDSNHNDHAYQRDPANRLHWRMNRRRLDSDSLLDSVQLVSGKLQRGPPPERLAIFAQEDQRLKSFNISGWRKPTQNRRTVYQPLFRSFVPADWSVFDFPDPELLRGQRDTSTVPTQALYFMNSPYIVEHSKNMAKLLMDEAKSSDASHLATQAYLRVLTRYPTQTEFEQCREFLTDFVADDQQSSREQAFAAFCQTLFASAEFRYVY